MASIGGRETTDRLPIFEVMFRYTLGPTLVGGPWRWGEMGDTPLVPAAPPASGVTVLIFNGNGGHRAMRAPLVTIRVPQPSSLRYLEWPGPSSAGRGQVADDRRRL